MKVVEMSSLRKHWMWISNNSKMLFAKTINSSVKSLINILDVAFYYDFDWHKFQKGTPLKTRLTTTRATTKPRRTKLRATEMDCIFATNTTNGRYDKNAACRSNWLSRH